MDASQSVENSWYVLQIVKKNSARHLLFLVIILFCLPAGKNYSYLGISPVSGGCVISGTSTCARATNVVRETRSVERSIIHLSSNHAPSKIPLCSQYDPIMIPPCFHYDPTMPPLWFNIIPLNPTMIRYAPIMIPLCSDYDPTMTQLWSTQIQYDPTISNSSHRISPLLGSFIFNSWLRGLQ